MLVIDLNHVEKLDDRGRIKRRVAVVVGARHDVGLRDIDDAHREVVGGQLRKCLQRRVGGVSQGSVERRIDRELLEFAKIRVRRSSEEKNDER